MRGPLRATWLLTTLALGVAPRLALAAATIESPEEGFRLRIGGYVQADARVFLADEEERGVDTFVIRRLRPSLDGTVAWFVDYRVLVDFAGSTLALLDAYADVHRIEEVRLRVGKMKEPFGIERLASPTNILFAERALPTLLAPNRDVGVMVHGALLEGAFSYQLGVFDGAPDGASTEQDTNDAKDVAVRVFLRPFRPTSIDPLRGLGLGLAVSAGEQRGNATATGLSSQKTSGQVSFLTWTTGEDPEPTTFLDGPRFRLSPQGYYYYGPVGFVGEYVRSSSKVRLGARTAHLDHDAWQIAGSYVLGGDASYEGVVPRHPIHIATGDWGALEIAARYGRLDLDLRTFLGGYADPNRSAAGARAFAFGLNWYPSASVKAVLDFERTVLVGGGVATDLPDENLLVARLQVVL